MPPSSALYVLAQRPQASYLPSLSLTSLLGKIEVTCEELSMVAGTQQALDGQAMVLFAVTITVPISADLLFTDVSTG